MNDGPLRRLYRELAELGDEPLSRLELICDASIDVLGVVGAGIMLMADRVHQGTLYATDEAMRALEELQNVAAEGPCIDAYTVGRPVLEPDLANAGVRTWPQLAPAAVDAGMQGLFSFPLQLDDTCVGAFNLYRDHPGHLTGGEINDARLLAAMAAREVLAMQAEAQAGSLPEQIADLSGDRTAIEQATGMAAAQLGVPVVEAARRLREFAREQDLSLTQLALDVVTRKLRLAETPPP